MIVNICIIVIASFIVILVIGILIALFQFRRTAKEAEKFLEMARHQIAPIVHDVTLIVDDGKKISETFKNQVFKLDRGVDAIKEAALNVKSFQSHIEERVGHPIVELIAIIATLAQVAHHVKLLFRKSKDRIES